MYSSMVLTKKAVCVYYSNKYWKQKTGWKQSYATKSAINIGISTRIKLDDGAFAVLSALESGAKTHSLVKLCWRFLQNIPSFLLHVMLSRLLNTEQSPFLGKVRHQSVLRMTRQGDRSVTYNWQMTDMPATTTTDRLKTGRNVELQTWGHSWSNHKGICWAFFSNCNLDVFWCIWGCL